MIYLDNAATSFIKPPQVYRAVSRTMLQASSPGRGAYRTAMCAAEQVYQCREEAAALFHMDDPGCVVMTFNATHALNIAIHSLVRPGMRVVISGFEHNAVTRPLRALGADVRIAGRRLFDSKGVMEAFDEQLKGAECAVCTHVSNVFGFVLPIREIAALCRERGVPLILDASQSAGILDLDMPALGASFIAMPGHKGLFGPQGTGLLLCAESGLPLLHGGAGVDSAGAYMPEMLPERLEAGTLNVPGIAGLCEGIRYVRERSPAAILAYEEGLLEQFLQRLRSIPGLRVFSGGEQKQCGIVSVACERLDSESLAARLDEKGVAVRGGLHCAPLAHESAGTLDQGTVRFSLSPFVSQEQIDRAADVLRSIF